MSQNFDFGSSNDKQRRAITTTEGPLLITAGPGTGKTFTLVKRVAYLIQEKKVDPSQILVATFTEKAAKELVTRISNELEQRGMSFDVSEMYVGTFHSICLRLIKEHVEHSNVRKNYRVADSFDQQYLVYQNLWSRFMKLPHFEDFPLSSKRSWDLCEKICTVCNTATEELLDVEAMLASSDIGNVSCGEVIEEYNNLLTEYNWLDFAHIQLEALQLLEGHPDVLAEVQQQIRYVMIDEYQDTNYIQERLTLLLSEESKNVCVVGDDDQALYRFRGATVRNILEFPNHFDGTCERIDLTENYRSDPAIVAFYNEWMEHTAGPKFRFDWGPYRFKKTIAAQRLANTQASTVLRVVADVDDWADTLCNLVIGLKKHGCIEDYNQIAFLFKSVKHKNALILADRFEERGVNVYSPRSDEFFGRDEIRLVLGILLLLFPKYVERLQTNDFVFLGEDTEQYYVSCIMMANNLLKEDANEDLRHWIASLGQTHYYLTENTDYNLSGLVYQLFEFEPFSSILDTPLDTGVYDQRAVRNLSKLVGVIGKFEYLQRVNVLSIKRIDGIVERFFNTYLKFLRADGISEYEDEVEYVPSGCVPFLTIHQSKGMEFPVVVVDSLYATPTKSSNDALQALRDNYGSRVSYEPEEDVKWFDFWRLYYTAFSRAQDLLLLTHPETSRHIGKAFDQLYSSLPNVNAGTFPYEAFKFQLVKESDLKPSFSFTTDVSLYEGCSLQYKFFRDLEFSPVRTAATLFGQLVHQTIEDVHRAALRGEADTITPENTSSWLSANYNTLSKSLHSYLTDAVITAAERQVQRYVERRQGKWEDIVEAEVEIGLAESDYIIHGTVDLVEGDGDTVDIVDFKSERKPDVNRDHEELRAYHKQLMLYAHLIEEKTGRKVGKMRLYYTGEESGNPEITFSHDRQSIESVVKEFDIVAHKIMRKEYGTRTVNGHLCRNCDFRFYCKK